MKKFFIVCLIALVAASSYMLFDIYRYRDVKDNFLAENPDCVVVSVHPYGEGKKNVQYWIRYKRKGDSKVFETMWFYQESVEDGKWEKLEEKSLIKDME